MGADTPEEVASCGQSGDPGDPGTVACVSRLMALDDAMHETQTLSHTPKHACERCHAITRNAVAVGPLLDAMMTWTGCRPYGKLYMLSSITCNITYSIPYSVCTRLQLFQFQPQSTESIARSSTARNLVLVILACNYMHA